MKKIILTLVLVLTLAPLLAIELFAQDPPSGYTTNYSIRKWSQGAVPTADSLNANWDLIDTKIKLAYDSSQAKLSLWTNQTVYGTKTIGGTLSLGSAGKLTLGTTAPASNGQIGYTGSYVRYYHSSGTIDTVATLDDIRTGAGDYVTTNTTQTITGAKTFDQTTITSSDFQHIAETITLAASSFSASGITTGAISSSIPYSVTTISGGVNGKIFYLYNSGSNAITLEDGTGNLQLGGNYVMGQYDAITLIYDYANSQWIELARSNN